MENSIVGMTVQAIMVRSFSNGMTKASPSQAKKTLSIKENILELLSFGIEILDVPRRYKVNLAFLVEVTDKGKKVLKCETGTVFHVDLQREILSPADFPITGFEKLACEAAAHNRVYLFQLTNNAPMGLLIPTPLEQFPKTIRDGLLEFLRLRGLPQ